jgi:uncharacterized protein YkwD
MASRGRFLPSDMARPQRFEVNRRAWLAGAFAAGLAPAGAARAAGPPSAETWTAYEARLRARLTDAGGGRFDAAAERALHRLTNGARATAGAGALAWDNELAATARAHAGDLAARRYVEHLSPEGFDPTDRLGLVARRTIGSASENITWHRGSKVDQAADLMRNWRASPPHWSNLLTPRYSHTGFGVVRAGDQVWAVGLYAKLNGVLSADLPFHLADVTALLSNLKGMPAGVASFWLEDQVRKTGRRGMKAPPGVYRLRIDLPLDRFTYDELYGPIFVLDGGPRQPGGVGG